MIFVPIPRERIPSEWERILSLIGPAIEHDRNATSDDVLQWLLTGRSEAFWVGVRTATGVAVTTTEEDVCWLNYASGTVTGGPKNFVASVRAMVGDVEVLARQAGCTELRLGGRNWSRVFPEWEHYDPDYPNRIRKRLNG